MITKLVHEVRAVKSKKELANIIKAQRISEKVLADTLKKLKTGVSELEVANFIKKSFIKYGAPILSFPPIVAFGKGSADIHHEPDKTKLKVGDFVMFDFGCTINHYCSDMTRTYIWGKPSARQKKVYKDVLQAMTIALNKLETDEKRCRVVDKSARSFLNKKYGKKNFLHGLGHGVGTVIHEWPNFKPKSADVLPVGCVITIEPGIYLKGFGGVRIEDMVLITKNGCKNLTNVPKDFEKFDTKDIVLDACYTLSMAKRKLKIGVLFGGKSAEHEVSLRSAENIINSLDKSKYEVVLIGINKAGKWISGTSSLQILDKTNPKLYKLNTANTQGVALVPQGEGKISNLETLNSHSSIDVVFPILHGPFGEDGTVQGLLKLANIPFVGVDVLGSAVGMDKDVMKRLLRDAGIKIGKFIVLKNGEKINFEKVKKDLGLPMFIKPANMGSSVGVSKVKNKIDFERAIKEAFKFDNKIIIEEFIDGREIECSVLGNDKPIASIPGEIKVYDEFYSYDTKYINDTGAVAEIPAKISKKEAKDIQEVAVKTFKALSCEGLGRVDSFLKKNGEIIVNEINTMPGFTSISMYPKMWEASGLPMPKLLDKLIDLAIERFKRDSKLKTSVN